MPEFLVGIRCLPSVVLDIPEEVAPFPCAPHLGEVVKFLVRQWHVQNGFSRVFLRRNKTPQNC